MYPSVFTKLFDDRPLDDAIEAAADIGYDGVEIMARDPHLSAETSRERAEEIRGLVTRHDLTIPCLGTYTGGYARKPDEECQAELETFERFLELSTVLEVDLLRHGAGRPSVREATDGDFERAADWLRRAADRAAAYDRTIGLEIHSDRLTETVASTLRLLQLIDRDNVGVIHDAGNMFLVNEDFGPSSVDLLGDRLVHVHVKDESRIDDSERDDAFELETGRGREVFRRELLGDGEVDHEPLFEALVDRGYDGYVTIETNVRRIDPVAVATREFEAVSELIARAR